MAIVVIAKNNTSSNIEVEDLGISIPVNSQVNLTDLFDYIEIVESDELKNYVQSADVTINDGTQDLNIQDGLKHIEIQSVYEDSFEDGGGSSPGQILPGLHITRTTDLSLTTSYQDVYFEEISIESEPSVLTWDQSNKDRILIKEDGLYQIHVTCLVQTTSSTDYSYFRVRRNDSDVVTPKDYFLRTYQNEIQQIKITQLVKCSINDFLTLQVMRGSYSNCNLLQAEFEITKSEGIQGPTGPPGGTTVDIQKDDLTVVSNCDALNFEGSVVVTDNGNNKATVTVIDEKYIPKFIEVLDTSGNVNVNVTSAIPIKFGSEIWKDVDVFDHSIISNASRIYVRQDGLYFCTYTLNVDNAASNRKTIKCYIRLNGIDIVEFSTSYSYARNTTDDKLTVQNSFYTKLKSNDYIELLAIREGSSGTARTIAKQSILSLELKRGV